jgi:hypothetical protein
MGYDRSLAEGRWAAQLMREAAEAMRGPYGIMVGLIVIVLVIYLLLRLLGVS